MDFDRNSMTVPVQSSDYTNKFLQKDSNPTTMEVVTQTNAVKSVMDTDIHAMLQDAEDYLNGELLRITEEWPSEREHQGESMLMPYLSYSKEHRYFYRIALANRNMLPVQKIFKPLWEKLVLPKCQMAGILQNCIPSF